MHIATFTSRTRKVLALSALALAIVVPAQAQAAEAYDAGMKAGCAQGYGRGETDAAGTIYSGCLSTIERIAANGTRLAPIDMRNVGIANPYAADTAAISGVAPSPDGAHVYVAYANKLIRLDRQASGSYRLSTTWAAERFPLNGSTYPAAGGDMASDNFGNIYLSTSFGRVVKYAASGAYLTGFTKFDGTDNYTSGIGVSRDGRAVLATGGRQGTVRRYELQLNGSYSQTGTVGRTDSACAATAANVTPTDVDIDPWGFVYVSDAACDRVLKFSPQGAYVATVGTATSAEERTGSTPTSVIVNHRGDVLTGLWNRLSGRAATNPTPGPLPAVIKPALDLTAPTLTAATLPTTTTTREVILKLNGHDAAGADWAYGIKEVRTANEDGMWGEWRAFSMSTKHTLTAGLTKKLVSIQVRDAAGHTSNVLTAKTQLVAAGTAPAPAPVGKDTVSPVLASVLAPAKTTTRAISLTITGSDNVGIAQVRTANEDGTFSAWRPFTSVLTPTLNAVPTGKSLTRGVFVQVRDAAGNESNIVYTKLVSSGS